MEIQKMPHNKHIGIASTIAGVFVISTATNSFEMMSGSFAFIVGIILWWINR